MIRSSIVAAIAVSAIATAAPAAADPEGDYLGILSNTPTFTVNGFTGPLLIAAGNSYCSDLRAGTPLDAVQGKAMMYPGATNYGAKAMVAAAQQALCPDTLHH